MRLAETDHVICFRQSHGYYALLLLLLLQSISFRLLCRNILMLIKLFFVSLFCWDPQNVHFLEQGKEAQMYQSFDRSKLYYLYIPSLPFYNLSGYFFVLIDRWFINSIIDTSYPSLLFLQFHRLDFFFNR